jgi:hypothetical protein
MPRLIHAAAFCVIVTLFGVVPPASAAPGDSVADPLPIPGGLPVTVSFDTTDADPGPSELVDSHCYGTPYSFAEYYSYDASGPVVFSLQTEDFGGAAAFFASSSTGALEQVAVICGSGGEAYLPEGEYLVMVGSHPQCCDENGNPLPVFGGSGAVAVREGPPQIEVTGELTSATANRKTGVVRLTGTVTCSSSGDFSVDGTLRQRVRKAATPLISGWGASGACTPGTPTTWRATLAPWEGSYEPGSAWLVMNVNANNGYTSDWEYSEQTVRLKSTTS